MAAPNQQATSSIHPKGKDDPLCVLIAPSNFKESAHADTIADWIERGVVQGMGDDKVVTKKCPIYDGGEGFVRGMVMAHGGVFRVSVVSGPLFSQSVPSQWGLINQGTTAVLEIASVAGLHLIPNEMRDIRFASSRGVGQLINIILKDPHITKIIVGCGDSGVSDAGVGMLLELGFAFLDADRQKVVLAGGVPNFVAIHTVEAGETINRRLVHCRFNGSFPVLPTLLLVDTNMLAVPNSPRDGAPLVQIEVVCNTDSVLVGPPGVVELYGPQKGGWLEDVQIMTMAMREFVNAVNRSLLLHDIDGNMPGSGASGGIGAALLALGAQALSRQTAMCRYFDVRNIINHTPWDLIITAEGKLDQQSTKGKALGALMKMAKERNIPVVAIAGTVEPTCIDQSGLWAATSILTGPMPLPMAVMFTEVLVTEQSKQVIRLIRLGRRM